MRVVIVGAGLGGLSVARALVDRGVVPIVVAPDHGATACGAGIASAQFVGADERRLALRSRAIVESLVATRRCGHAQIATTPAGARSLDGLEDVRDGLPRPLERVLDRAFRRTIERAVFEPHGLWLRTGDLLAALSAGSRRAVARAHAVGPGTVLTDRGAIPADRIVLALGASTSRLARRLGLGLRREPARAARLRAELPSMLHVVETSFYARPDGRGRALGGDGSIATIRREAARVFGRAVECRAVAGGHVAFSRSGSPVLRQLDETTFVLTAFGGDGLALAPALGERVAARLLGESAPLAWEDR